MELARIFTIKKFPRSVLEIDNQVERAIGQNMLAVVTRLKVGVVPQPRNVLVQRRTRNVPV
jgi:hypothetical protein